MLTLETLTETALRACGVFNGLMTQVEPPKDGLRPRLQLSPALWLSLALSL